MIDSFLRLKVVESRAVVSETNNFLGESNESNKLLSRLLNFLSDKLILVYGKFSYQELMRLKKYKLPFIIKPAC